MWALSRNSLRLLRGLEQNPLVRIRQGAMDELGIDELALVFQAVERSAAGAKALGACEQVCEGWRDVLRSREGALAWHRVAGGPQLQAVWQHPDAAGAAPRFADRPEALADEIASLKKAVAGTETLALLGGLAHALEGDPDGDVNVWPPPATPLQPRVPARGSDLSALRRQVTADDDGAWQFLLDPVRISHELAACLPRFSPNDWVRLG